MAAITIGRRGRLALKIAGYVVLALVSFVFALQLTFPYHRVKDKVIEVLGGSYDVTIGDVSRGIMPGTFTLEKVTLRSRPTKADEVPAMTYFEEIEVDAGILSLIRGVGSADFEVTMGKGTLEGSVEVGKDSFELEATATGLPADSIPQIREVLGLPLVGKLNASVRLSLPKWDWRQGTGALNLDCPKNCTLGDGVTKFKPKVKSQRSATMMGEGIEFGHVYIDRVTARVQLGKGKLEVTKFDFQSKDAELKIDFALKLGKKLKESEFQVACIRFRATEALQEREAKTAAAIATTGGVLGPDKLFHIKIEGRVSEVRPRGRVCSGEGADEDTAGGPDTAGLGRGVRPTLAPVTGGGDGNGSGAPAGGTLRDVNSAISDINPAGTPPPSGPIDAAPAPGGMDAAPAAMPPTVPAVPPGVERTMPAPDNGAGAPVPGAPTPAPTQQPGDREVRDEPPPPVAPKENE